MSSNRQDRRAQARQAGRCPTPPHRREVTASGRVIWHQLATRCRNRRCPSCGILWAGDTRVKLLRNIDAYAGDVALITITAPGEDFGLIWDSDTCDHDPERPCSGKNGCRVHPDAAHQWNKAAPGNWSALHKRAQSRARRAAKRAGGDGFRLVAKTWEYQRRGVLHLHLVVGMTTPTERLAALVYIAALDELRELYCFGYVDRGPKAPPAHGEWTKLLKPDRRGGRPRMPRVIERGRAANYLAKYVAGSKTDGTLALTETVRHRDVPGHVIYVGRQLTAQTNCTMRTLREHRHAYTLWNRALDYGLEHLLYALPDDAGDRAIIDALQSQIPPPNFQR